jgi:hypothetical protein
MAQHGGLLPQTFNGKLGSGKSRLGPYAKGWVHSACICLVGLLLLRAFGASWRTHSAAPSATESDAVARRGLQDAPAVEPVLVSYSYYEKDHIQRSNMEFFMAVGMGMFSQLPAPAATDFVIVISGGKCTPCKALMPMLKPVPDAALLPTVTAAWTKADGGLTILHRKQNEGMDIAAHNITLDWVADAGARAKYKHFIFLNSSVRGPFVPNYLPRGWQWTQAFTARLSETVKLVASSLVCLPAVDAGGAGPKAESWAFGTDIEGLRILVDAGVFGVRACKLCNDGIVVQGEYGLTNVLMSHGYNIATLMARYAPGTDWRDDKHWSCNDCVHPSRSGTYDDITMHPFETVFVKSSWHVGEPFTSHYTKWFMGHALGQDNTAGQFNERLYRYGVSLKAQEPREAESFYRIQI